MYGELIMDAVPEKVSENYSSLGEKESPCVIKRSFLLLLF